MPAHVDNLHWALGHQQHWSAKQNNVRGYHSQMTQINMLGFMVSIDLLLLYSQSTMTIPLPAFAYITAHSGPDLHYHLQWMLGQWTSAGTSGNKTQKHQVKCFSMRTEHNVAIHEHAHTWNFSLQVPTLTSVPQITSLWPAFNSLATVPSAFDCKVTTFY